MFFRYVLDEKLYKIQNGNGFFNIRVILVFVIMKGHVSAIVRINSGGGNNRASKITADIFNDGIRITEVRLGINIESIFVFAIDGGLDFFVRSCSMTGPETGPSGLRMVGKNCINMTRATG